MGVRHSSEGFKRLWIRQYPRYLRVFAAGLQGPGKWRAIQPLGSKRISRPLLSPPRLARIVASAPGVIRIDAIREGSSLVFRVAGSIAGPDVAVLQDSVSRQGLPDRIDLSEVEFVDAEGASELLGLEARGAELVGAEPFVELLLRAPPGSTPR